MKYGYIFILLLCAHCASANNYAFIRPVPDTLRYHNSGPSSVTLDVDVNNDGVNDVLLLIQNFGSGSLTTTAQSDNSTSGWNIEVDQLYPNTQQVLPYNCGAYVNTGEGFATHGEMTLFKGNGARYISVRKQLASGWYNYGWIKVDVSPSGGTMIVYATGYSDELGGPSDTYHRTGLNECIATGIDENSSTALKMYESENRLYIDGNERSLIKIYDLSGKIVSTLDHDSQHTMFDLQHLGAGCYFAEVVVGETRKVMKITVL